MWYALNTNRYFVLKMVAKFTIKWSKFPVKWRKFPYINEYNTLGRFKILAISSKITKILVVQFA